MFGRCLFIPGRPVATPPWRRGTGRHSQAHGASQTGASRSGRLLSPAGLWPLRPLPLYRPMVRAVLTTVPAGRPRVSRPNAVGTDSARLGLDERSSARLEGPCPSQAAGARGPRPVSHGLLLGGPAHQHHGLGRIWFKTPIFRVRMNSWSGRKMSPLRGPRPMARRVPAEWNCHIGGRG